MKNEWFVSTNIIGGQKVYQVVRFKDSKGAVDHRGVREVFGPVMTNKERADRMAQRLNEGEKDEEEDQSNH